MKLKDFPTSGLLPKTEIQAVNFLKKYPSYDGRGVVVAILDTGVDPAASGLQLTTEGKPKIIDIVDCTGSGDVVLSEPLSAEVDLKSGLQVLKCRNGEKVLKLNPKWQNPSGKFRVGTKRGYDIFPKELVARLSKENQRKFELKHQELISHVLSELNTLEQQLNGVLTEEEIEHKADLEAKLDVLKEQMKNYEDFGPLYDIVTYHDGTNWRAVLDLKEDGDLTGIASGLADYAVGREFDYFSAESALTFNVKFYDDGEMLSIVCCGGSHGTHVAAICGANFPDTPELNGVAPGCQFISLKIGDTRLKTMETGTGLFRAVQCMLEHKCDVANMSYGEDATLANSGFWSRLLQDELINKAQITFISSAGNAGPALSTVGCPGGTVEGVIGVGAYVSDDMMSAEYGLSANSSEVPYTWSSRGPAMDGDRGVSVYSMGGAITSVPQYLLKNSQLMNGTSMSSPNCCGAVSLLISALKQNSYKYSPYRIKQTLENTSKSIGDQMQAGLIQVEDAYSYLVKYQKDVDQDVLYQVRVNGSQKRGIYLREESDTYSPQSLSVNVQPRFRDSDVDLNSNRLQLEQKLTLASPYSWIKVPDHLLLNSGGRDFQVVIDPTNLKDGQFYYGEICAYESGNIEKGPIFRVPVSVCKPTLLPITDASYSYQQLYDPGSVDRKFIQIPNGATFADIEISAVKVSESCRFVVHLVQLVPQSRHSNTEQHWYFSFDQQTSKKVKSFRVYGGLTMELCTAQFWSVASANEFKVTVKVHSLQIEPQNLVFSSADVVQKLNVNVISAQNEKLKLQADLSAIQRPLRPNKAIIKPLKSRDVLPNGFRVNELMLHYSLNLAEATSVSFLKPLADNLLYESEFDSVLLMVLDSNNQMVHFDDVYPKSVKLQKGDYVIKLQLRHADTAVLDQLKDFSLIAQISLSKSEALKFYSTRPDIVNGRVEPMKFNNIVVKAGSQRALFVTAPIQNVKGAQVGDCLAGQFKVNDIVIDGEKFSATVFVGLPQTSGSGDKSKGSEDGNEDKDSADVMNKLKDDLLKAQLKYLPQIKSVDQQKQLIAQLEKDYPDNVDLKLGQLSLIVDECKKSKLSSNLASQAVQIQSLGKVIIALGKEKEVTEYFGTKKSNVDSKESKKVKKEMDSRKKNITIARYWMLMVALSQSIESNGPFIAGGALKSDWESFYSYLDDSNSQHVIAQVVFNIVTHQYGSALKLVNKLIGDYASSKLKDSNVDLCLNALGVDGDVYVKYSENKKLQLVKVNLMEKLDWPTWAQYETQWTAGKYPHYESTF
ncbi:hypothetical protein MIR68_008363 [Amoeboaphelidium protococcarum]|nr:hypothetical protein MIR68_008363 [Amoeboaphelidium protococcarum]